MYKKSKVLILSMLVFFMCSNITYGVEPPAVDIPAADNPVVISPVPTAEPTGIQPLTPTPASSPAPSPTPSPSPLPEQPVKDNAEEARLKEAADFRDGIDAIVMKRINNYFKKGGKGTIGIFIKELGTGYEYAYNAEKTNPDNQAEGFFNTASTCKLLSAAVIYRLDLCGELELDAVCRDNITKREYNLRKILPRMISHSVNDYFNITLRHLGSAKINKELLALGLKSSIVYSEIMPAEYSSVKNNIKRYGISRSPRTTPRDLGLVLELLYDKKTFGEDNSKLFLQSLLDNIYSNRLPAGVGYRSPVAHKTGTSAGEGVYNDAGIIFLDGNPYIMVVMSKGSNSGVQSFFRGIAGEVYDHMKKRTEAQSSSFLAPQ